MSPASFKLQGLAPGICQQPHIFSAFPPLLFALDGNALQKPLRSRRCTSCCGVTGSLPPSGSMCVLWETYASATVRDPPTPSLITRQPATMFLAGSHQHFLTLYKYASPPTGLFDAFFRAVGLQSWGSSINWLTVEIPRLALVILRPSSGLDRTLDRCRSGPSDLKNWWW